ncbi:aminoglycoside phosphotransferase family protein [Candidatus Woesearchaeota archaeon]|nr:aminoglycoside phosphotransferase family protein [Candidatus Woesearchaeota archaeon]
MLVVLSNSAVLRVVKEVEPGVNSVRIREFTEAGNINLMYKVTTDTNTNYVVRGAPNRFEVSKYDKELFIHDLVNKQLGVPVPKIYFFDKSKKILPFAYLFMEFMNGNLASVALDKMGQKQRLGLFRQLGRILAELHSIKFKSYGRFFGSKISRYEERYAKPFNSWEEFYVFTFNKSVSNFVKAKNLSYGQITKTHFLELIPALKAHLNDKKTKIKSVSRPSLIHDDFRLFNILVKDNKVTAILDFEMAKSGAPENELCIIPFLWDENNALKLTKQGKAFLKGYGAVPAEVIENRKLYAPLDLFMETSYDFFHGMKYKGVNQVMLNSYFTIRYLLGLISLKEYKLGISSNL